MIIIFLGRLQDCYFNIVQLLIFFFINKNIFIVVFFDSIRKDFYNVVFKSFL